MLQHLTDPVRLTAEICNINSVSGNETALADQIWETLLQHAPHLKLHRDGDCIIARTEFGCDTRVLVAGHIDTVPVNHNLPVQQRTIDGAAQLWGRGTVDMKAGVAVQLCAALQLREAASDITWVWYDHEEVSSELNGLGRALRNSPQLFAADFAILGEPSNSVIEAGCNGTLRALVRFTGKRAHSARSWCGVNAIHRSYEALQKLAQYQAETVTVAGLEYRESLNAVGISGGIAGNVIPDEVVIDVNYRFAPAKTEAAATVFVRDFFAMADSLEIIDSAPGAQPGTDSEFATRLAAQVGAQIRPKLGWTDVARFTALNIPAVNYGPGNPELAHADDEAVAVAEITACYQGLMAFLAKPSA